MLKMVNFTLCIFDHRLKKYTYISEEEFCWGKIRREVHMRSNVSPHLALSTGYERSDSDPRGHVQTLPQEGAPVTTYPEEGGKPLAVVPDSEVVRLGSYHFDDVFVKQSLFFLKGRKKAHFRFARSTWGAVSGSFQRAVALWVPGGGAPRPTSEVTAPSGIPQGNLTQNARFSCDSQVFSRTEQVPRKGLSAD